MLKRMIKNFGKGALRRAFETGQSFGVDILPHHFYSEIPDIKELRRADYWKKPHSLYGVRGADLSSQLGFIKECCSPSLVARQKKGGIYLTACSANDEPGFGPVEADFLFCFIATQKPKKIVQIGCGVSTAVILQAAEESGYAPEITCIDPFPTAYLVKMARHGRIRLVDKMAQVVPLEELTDLGGESGLLFVDSTHTVKPGSEVNRIILEALPRLPKGSWVHFHDIYFPYDYSRHVLDSDLFFPSETALLHAFLINNSHCQLRASLAMLHYGKSGDLHRLLPNYQPAGNHFGLETFPGHFPSSIYLRTE